MEQYWPLILFVISASITPGPNNVMILSSGVNHGVRNSIPHFLGIVFGFTLMVFSLGMGFGVIFENYPIIHQLIKIIGIIYLLFLAWMIASSSNTSLENSQAKPISFWQAVLFQWVNPKAWVMITGAIAAFTTLSGDLLSEVLIITFLFCIFVIPCVSVWLFFGVALRKYMKKSQHLKIFNGSMAALLVISITPTIYELLINYINI
jgi:threonine/homoserine/homoserine lactone efflux protein